MSSCSAIRPFVIGRRNWLFADTPNSAHASAALYSVGRAAALYPHEGVAAGVIETAKANGHEPYLVLGAKR